MSRKPKEVYRRRAVEWDSGILRLVMDDESAGSFMANRVGRDAAFWGLVTDWLNTGTGLPELVDRGLELEDEQRAESPGYPKHYVRRA